VTECQAPVELPGILGIPVMVYPGDFILSDIDGIIVPAQCILQVLEKVELLTKKEVDIIEALVRGMSLCDALKNMAVFNH